MLYLQVVELYLVAKSIDAIQSQVSNTLPVSRSAAGSRFRYRSNEGDGGTGNRAPLRIRKPIPNWQCQQQGLFVRAAASPIGFAPAFIASAELNCSDMRGGGKPLLLALKPGRWGAPFNQVPCRMTAGLCGGLLGVGLSISVMRPCTQYVNCNDLFIDRVDQSVFFIDSTRVQAR